MDAYWFVLMPFVMAAVLVAMSSRRRTECPNCGCEADASDTSGESSPARQWVALVALIAVGVGLGGAVLFIGSRAPAPPVVAAPQPSS